MILILSLKRAYDILKDRVGFESYMREGIVSDAGHLCAENAPLIGYMEDKWMQYLIYREKAKINIPYMEQFNQLETNVERLKEILNMRGPPGVVQQGVEHNREEEQQREHSEEEE